MVPVSCAARAPRLGHPNAVSVECFRAVLVACSPHLDRGMWPIRKIVVVDDGMHIVFDKDTNGLRNVVKRSGGPPNSKPCNPREFSVHDEEAIIVLDGREN